MPFVLPVEGGLVDDRVDGSTAQMWETTSVTAGPSGTAAIVDGPNLGSHEGRVTLSRTGPGDVNLGVDQWMNPDIYVVPRQGVMRGRELFDANVWQPPNEGHGEYGFAQDGPKIDHSTRDQALFWSDWNASTALQAGGRGSFTGEHVVIVRVPPGSTQGYMPSDPGMLQYNTDRAMPRPWDTLLTIGQAAT